MNMLEDKRKIKVILIPNPFDRSSKEIVEVDYKPLETVDYYAKKCNVNVDYVASINGNVVSSDTVVYENSEVVIVPDLKKHAFGNIFRAVISAVVMAVSFHLPAWLGIAGRLASALISAGASLGGLMIMNALFPARPPKLSWESEASKSSPTYSWDGIQTIAKEGVVIPVVYGKMKLGGNVISRYVEVADNNKQYLNMIIALCHGKVDNITDIRINNNPIGNYRDVSYELRYGLNDQDVVDYMNIIETDNTRSVVLTTSPYQDQTQGNAVEALRLDFVFPYGLFYLHKKGRYKNRSVTIYVEYKLTTDTEWTRVSRTFTSAEPSVRRVNIKINNLTPGKYDIRVWRYPPEGNMKDRYYDRVMLVNIAEIIKKDLAYPNLAYVAIRALATDQLSGVMPNITCIVERTTFGSDDIGVSPNLVGKRADNPAWVVYDILTNKLYGGGMYGLDDDYVDYDSFQEWADFCDAEGLKCNTVFDTQSTLWEACIRIASEHRGILKIEGTKVSVTVDKETNPTQLFSMGNILRDTFKEVFLPQRERVNCLEVTFLNAEHDYERETFIVYTDDWAYGKEVKSSISLYSITNYEQAVKHAQYMLNYNKYITRSIEFEADIDSLACNVGDVIRVQYDVPEWGYGGRILEADSNRVVLDRKVSLVSGNTYKLVYRKENDTVYEKTFTATNTEDTDTLYISFASDEIPEKFNVYAFGQVNLAYKEFRIISIDRVEDLRCRITAVEYNPSIYTDRPQIAPLPSAEDLFTIYDLRGVEEYVLFKDGTIGSRIHLTWIYNGGAVKRWHIYVRDVTTDESGNYVSDDLSWKYVCSTDTVDAYVRYEFIDSHTYDVAVCYEDYFGHIQNPDEAPSVQVTILGKELPPYDVTGLSVEIDRQNGIVLTWDENPDVDLAGYNIYIDYELAVEKYKGTKYVWGSQLVGTHTFSVKAVDTSGNLSENFANVTVTVEPPVITNLKARSIDNNVLLFWKIQEKTFAFSHCIVKKGNSFETGEVIGTKKGSFTSFFEDSSGTFTYWVAPVDAIGNVGQPVSVTVHVSNPPDYVLNVDWFSDFKGTKENVVVTNNMLFGNVLSETYEEHFTSRGWNSPQDQIDAGYPIYIQPLNTTGSYEEVFDYGTVLSATMITVNMTVYNKTSDFDAVCHIYTSEDGSSWTDHGSGWQAYATDFRYVKIHIDFTTSSDKDWFEISQIEVVLDSKLKSDAGRAYAHADDSDGTEVPFNVDFIDVTSITVTPESDSNLVATYQFNDVPHPTSFRVFLFDSSGNRVSGWVSWQARGY